MFFFLTVNCPTAKDPRANILDNNHGACKLIYYSNLLYDAALFSVPSFYLFQSRYILSKNYGINIFFSNHLYALVSRINLVQNN